MARSSIFTACSRKDGHALRGTSGGPASPSIRPPDHDWFDIRDSLVLLVPSDGGTEM